MEMTNNEIVAKFKRAESKKEQISILAQLNACDEEKIKQILLDEGIPEEQIQPSKNKRGKKPVIKNKIKPQNNYSSESITEDKKELLPLSEHNKYNIPYRTGDILLQQPEDMTEDEKERLKRIQAIPEVARKVLQKEINQLLDEILELKSQLDILVDYLNGECRG